MPVPPEFTRFGGHQPGPRRILPHMALKALEIKAFEPLDKPYHKADAKGLYLEVRPNGLNSRFSKCRIFSTEKRLNLHQH